MSPEMTRETEMITNYLPTSAAAARTQYLLEVAEQRRLARVARTARKGGRAAAHTGAGRRRFALLPAYR